MAPVSFVLGSVCHGSHALSGHIVGVTVQGNVILFPPFIRAEREDYVVVIVASRSGNGSGCVTRRAGAENLVPEAKGVRCRYLSRLSFSHRCRGSRIKPSRRTFLWLAAAAMTPGASVIMPWFSTCFHNNRFYNLLQYPHRHHSTSFGSARFLRLYHSLSWYVFCRMVCWTKTVEFRGFERYIGGFIDFGRTEECCDFSSFDYNHVTRYLYVKQPKDPS